VGCTVELKKLSIASTHFAYPQRDGQAELAWVAWSNEYQDGIFVKGHPSRY